MNIYDTIKLDLTFARKKQNKADVTILSTILGEMSSKATLVINDKIVSDTDAIAVLKKSIKGLDEMISLASDKTAHEYEKTVLEGYLPTQLSEEKLKQKIALFLLANEESNPPMTFGDVMSHLKTNYTGLYDGKMASTMAKELLTVKI